MTGFWCRIECVSGTNPDALRRTGVGQIQRWPSWGMGILPCPKYGRTMKENGATPSVRRQCLRILSGPCGFLTCRADSGSVVRIFYGVCGFSTCRVDSEQAVRIPNDVCGFSASRADFRQVVRIVCDPEPTGNRPFRAKKRRFRAYTAGNPPDESAQVLENPHDQFRIRTVNRKSARPVRNPHDRLKNPHSRSRIHTVNRKSAQLARNPHDRLKNPHSRSRIHTVRFPMPQIADDLFTHHAKDSEHDGPSLPQPQRNGHISQLGQERRQTVPIPRLQIVGK